MKFVYKNDVYALNFQRRQRLVKVYADGVGGKEQLSKYPDTEVTLLKLDPMELGTKNAIVVAYGSTSCYHKDKFNPEIGRRNALRDLCLSPRNRNERNGQPARIPRAMSKLIWKAYFHRNDPDFEVTDEGNGGTNVPPIPPQNVIPILEAEVINESMVVS